jgi:hypothetical protein
MEEKCFINIWINEERDEKLSIAGLGDLTKVALAGMKILRLHCNKEQKNEILKLYPMAKYDSATTKSIELLPPEVKNKIFNLIIKNKSLNVLDEFLK